MIKDILYYTLQNCGDFWEKGIGLPELGELYLMHGKKQGKETSEMLFIYASYPANISFLVE